MYDVICNVWNEEANIRKVLDSIIRQTMPPRSIIIVNDGSTDATPEIIQEYCTTHKHIRVVNRPIHHESSLILTSPIMSDVITDGLHEIDTDAPPTYVAITGGDIVYTPDYFQRVTQYMDAHPQCAIAAGTIRGEPRSMVPGGVRVIRAAWLATHHMQMLRCVSYETWCVIQAHYDGYTTDTVPGCMMDTLRPTGTIYPVNRYYKYGVSSREVGYTMPYIMMRGVVLSMRQRNLRIFFKFMAGWRAGDPTVIDPDLRRYCARHESSIWQAVRRQIRRSLHR